ncbi:hypothetical protein [Helicobacter pylori]|uniref:hypothetical protein n=1 Tax=Helicobacter pylori TaxID=210 RepID=UPI0027399C04|nr:hypothetical protein [Helicobacter pylori]
MPVTEAFLMFLGFFGGGFCAHAIIKHCHLSGFFVWVVYALCIFFGGEIALNIYDKLVEHKNRVIRIIAGIMGIGGVLWVQPFADKFIEHYHLSGFFVVVVYALGIGIVGVCHYFLLLALFSLLFKLSKNWTRRNIIVIIIVGIILVSTMLVGILGFLVVVELVKIRFEHHLRWF